MPDGEFTFEKFDQERREQYLKLVSEGVGLHKAAYASGVSHELVRQYKFRYPEFVKLERAAQQLANGEVESALFRNATIKLNVVAQLAWLYNRCPGRWKDKRNVGKDTPDLDLTKLTDAELLEWKRLADKAAKGGKEVGPDATVEGDSGTERADRPK